MTEKTSTTEEKVVQKIAELMETLDQVKKYNALANSFKTFFLILTASIVVYAITLQYVFPKLSGLNWYQLGLASILWWLIPISGIAIGALVIRIKIKAVKTAKWKTELSSGFPAALKMLLGIDWDETFDEISIGKIGYMLYGVVKVIAYFLVTVFTLSFTFNLIEYLLIHQMGVLGGSAIWISPFITYLLVRNDLSRRYSEIRVLDRLLWELRGLSNELTDVEF